MYLSLEYRASCVKFSVIMRTLIYLTGKVNGNYLIQKQYIFVKTFTLEEVMKAQRGVK
jgi:hypothetical protein